MKAKLPFLQKKSKARLEDEDEEFEDEEIDDSEGTDPGVTDAHTRVASLKELEEDDDDAEDEEDKTLPGQTKSLLNKLKNLLNKEKKSSSDDDEEDDEESESESVSDDAAAQKKKKIRLFVLAGIVIAVLFLIPDEPEEVPVPQVPAAKERPYKKDVKTETPVEAPSDGAVTEAPAETPSDSTLETPPETSGEAGTEEQPVADTPETTIEPTPETPVEANPEEPTEARPDIETESPGESESPDSAGEGTIPVSPMESSGTDMESTIDSTDPVEEKPDISETVGGEEPTVDESAAIGETAPDLTEQILQDLEDQEKVRKKTKEPVTTYVAPPPYQFSGRGLVYNCKGKHWACVDGGSYRVCEDNFSGNQYLRKNTECYPFNVYQTENGCEITQKRMVTSSAKTSFCND